ncbi:acetamidase/formamidase family protein [Aliikangiella maris]|uniref:Acetamidase/formamidase family protein n=2 Tax=Aliikangiella maris TaxID=3162458 RepID=A0ABV2BWQ2_9GAMM
MPPTTHYLKPEQKHYRFSHQIPNVMKVPSGSVISASLEEASDNRIYPRMTSQAFGSIDWSDFGHPLAGPIYIDGAQPGDVLAVKLHKMTLKDWGWSASTPLFSYLKEGVGQTQLKTYAFDQQKSIAYFDKNIKIPLSPFPGIIAVAPDTDEMLSTIPPRENGGNLDDPNITEGTTVYLPVLVEGALFSIGDPHAAQGHGEVSGTAIEAPMDIIFEVSIIKNQKTYLKEVQYETKEHYAVTAFALTLDEAAKKATRFMISYLESEYKMSPQDANILCSIAADLKIAEVVDGNVLVAMHIPKRILSQL